jgi:RNA-directed DNA polymerase
MAGPTGVGKTSLVQQIAWMLGAGYEVIPVRPAWTDPTYLLGFYNPIQRCYQPTPFIHKLNEARKWEQANRLFFLCLDEMNLARIENYAADLLSRLEKSRYTNAFLDLYSPEEEHSLLTERKELAERVDVLKPEERRRLLLLHTRLDTFKARFLLPKNLVLCGTVNMDETTHPFSPKVLDRAFVVRFPSAQFGQIDSIRSIDERPTPAVWPLATPVLQELLNSQASEDFDKSLRGIWQEFLAWESAYLRPLGVQLGYRFPVTYKLFMHLGHKLLDANPRELASVFFQAKLLPRVSFNQQDKARGPDARKIDIFGQWRDDPSLDKYPKKDGFDLRQAFQDMIDRNAGRPVIQYW